MKNITEITNKQFVKRSCFLVFVSFVLQMHSNVFQNKIKQDTLLNKIKQLNELRKYKQLLELTTKKINNIKLQSAKDSLQIAKLYYYQFEANYYLKNYLKSITSANKGILFCPNNERGKLEKGKLYYKKSYGESQLNYAKRSEKSMKVAIDNLSIKNDDALDFLVNSYVFLSSKYAYYGDLKNAKYYLRLAENTYLKNKTILDKITTNKSGNAHRYEIILLYRKIYLLYKLAKTSKDSLELIKTAKKLNQACKSPLFNRREQIYYTTALNHIGDWYISYKEDSLITNEHLKQGNYYLDKSIDLIENKKYRGDYITFKFNKCKSFTKQGKLKKANSLILHLLDSMSTDDYRKSFFLAQKGLIKAKLKQKDSALLTFFKSIEKIHSGKEKLAVDYSNFKPSKTFGETRLIRRIAEKLDLFYGKDDDVKKTISKLYSIAFLQFKNSYAKSKFNPKENLLLRKIIHGILVAKKQNKLPNISIKNILSDLEVIANQMNWQRFYQNRYTNNLPQLDSLNNKHLKLRRVFANAKIKNDLRKKDSIKQAINKHIGFTQKQYPNLSLLSSNLFNLSELQNRMKDDELLLKYLLLDNKMVVFSITNTQIDWVLKPWGAEQIKLIKAFVNNIKQRKLFNKQDAFLSKYLMPKIDDRIKNIIVQPDGEIYTIPFEVLKNNNHFLAENYNIRYTSNLNFIHLREKKSKKEEYKLAIYSPTYKENNIGFVTRNNSAKLYGAKKESEAISKFFESKIYLNDNFSKKQFFKTAPNANILHLAMHAKIDTIDSGLSKLLFTESKDNLFLEELYALKLKADLAVLSACNTGVGNENSARSLESFQRAFMFAGVPATVASLWEVPDISTSEIMEGFYKYLKKGFSKSRALKNAKLDYLNLHKGTKLGEPYYWAGFVLYGNEVPINIPEKSNYIFVFLVILLLFLISFYVKYSLKKK